jgi:hypothetical protein
MDSQDMFDKTIPKYGMNYTFQYYIQGKDMDVLDSLSVG